MAYLSATSEQTYKCKCHVCGKDFEVKAIFISTRWVTSDGKVIRSCGEHSREEVQASCADGGFAFSNRSVADLPNIAMDMTLAALNKGVTNGR